MASGSCDGRREWNHVLLQGFISARDAGRCVVFISLINQMLFGAYFTKLSVSHPVRRWVLEWLVNELGRLEGSGRSVIKVFIGGNGENNGKPRSGLSVSQSKLEPGTSEYTRNSRALPPLFLKYVRTSRLLKAFAICVLLMLTSWVRVSQLIKFLLAPCMEPRNLATMSTISHQFMSLHTFSLWCLKIPLCLSTYFCVSLMGSCFGIVQYACRRLTNRSRHHFISVYVHYEYYVRRAD
jgi:hypothetical protein